VEFSADSYQSSHSPYLLLKPLFDCAINSI